MSKEELQPNSFTKETRPTTGEMKGGFGRRAFGTAVFGEKTGYEQPKEVLPTNSQTKETLPSKIS